MKEIGYLVQLCIVLLARLAPKEWITKPQNDREPRIRK